MKHFSLVLKETTSNSNQFLKSSMNTAILVRTLLSFVTNSSHIGQSFNDFVTELKRRSSECEFDTLQDSLIRDMIVCGVTDRSLRERLLRDAELTLEKAVAAGHAAEETRRHAKELRSYQDNVNRRTGKEHKKHDKDKRDKQSKHENDRIKKCKFCNSTHPRGKCPAYGKNADLAKEKTTLKFVVLAEK